MTVEIAPSQVLSQLKLPQPWHRTARCEGDTEVKKRVLAVVVRLAKSQHMRPYQTTTMVQETACGGSSASSRVTMGPRTLGMRTERPRREMRAIISGVQRRNSWSSPVSSQSQCYVHRVLCVS